MKTVGEQAKEFRLAKGWNTTRMAKEVKTSRQNIEHLEARGDITPHYISGLAKAMGLSVDALLGHANTAHITAPMPTLQASGGPTVLSPMANALGQLFDMLPQDAVTRTRAYNRATEAILRVLQGIEDQPTHTPAPSDPAQTPPARRLTDAHS